MVAFGAAKLDHHALNSLNGEHRHNHGDAFRLAAPALNADLVSELQATKKCGDAARHCLAPDTFVGTARLSSSATSPGSFHTECRSKYRFGSEVRSAAHVQARRHAIHRAACKPRAHDDADGKSIPCMLQTSANPPQFSDSRQKSIPWPSDATILTRRTRHARV